MTRPVAGVSRRSVRAGSKLLPARERAPLSGGVEPAAGEVVPPAGEVAPPAGNDDLPAGTMVYRMSRTDFDVRCDEDFWKRGDYDARRGLAEVVETPLLGHEWRGREVTALVLLVCGESARATGAIRIEWGGSILEPDESFYFEPFYDLGYSEDENCRPELGHRPPALVVEINRSSSPARAAEKRQDYFDLGVREVWTWRPKDGATIYRPFAGGPPRPSAESKVVPGVTREDLDELWAEVPWSETPGVRAAVVRRVGERRGRAAASAEGSRPPPRRSAGT